jgi:hypothetical protein
MGWQVLIQPMSILEFWLCPTTIEMHEKEFKTFTNWNNVGCKLMEIDEHNKY